MHEPKPHIDATSQPVGTDIDQGAPSNSILDRFQPLEPLHWPTRLPNLTVIIPTRNEAPNIEPLLAELAGVGPRQVLFVDDSDDHTPQLIRSRTTIQVRLLHRDPADRAGGLGSAVLLGIDACTTRFCAVMDGDLQHPADVLTQLNEELARGASVAIASRYSAAGSTQGLGGPLRQAVSRSSNALARFMFPTKLGHVSDPMSGMFALDRDTVNTGAIRPDGFKVLLEILVMGEPGAVKEVPYTFREREAGDSKAGMREGFRYLKRLGELRIAAWRS